MKNNKGTCECQHNTLNDLCCEIYTASSISASKYFLLDGKKNPHSAKFSGFADLL